MRALAGLPYPGNKTGASGSNTGTNRFINAHLPHPKSYDKYVEPFAGMLGVLLSRPPVLTEVANDIDGRIVNWWRVVRDKSDELAHKMRYTPYSRQEYETAYELRNSEDDVTQAWATTVLLTQSIYGMGLAGDKTKFRIHMGTNNYITYSNRIEKLANRLRKVVLENRPAEQIIQQFCKYPDSLIYADPPYISENVGDNVYRHGNSTFNKNSMLELFDSCVGSVAISGYADDWDDLGWYKVEHETKSIIAGEGRTEVLWLNYEPQISQGNLF